MDSSDECTNFMRLAGSASFESAVFINGFQVAQQALGKTIKAEFRDIAAGTSLVLLYPANHGRLGGTFYGNKVGLSGT